MKERLLLYLVHLLCSTSKADIRGLDSYEKYKNKGRGAVLCLWHGKMLFPLFYFRHRGLRPIISMHRDGELLARVSLLFGYRPIRGSSTHFGGTALTEALRSLERGEDVVFAADGPRGPYHKLKPGCIYAAARTGSGLFIGSYASKPSKKLRSWDRFNLFPPFSRIIMEIKGPFFPSQKDMAGWKEKIQGEMEALDSRLEAEVSEKLL